MDERTHKVNTQICDLWSRLIQEDLDGHKLVLDTFRAFLPVVSTPARL